MKYTLAATLWATLMHALATHRTTSGIEHRQAMLGQASNVLACMPITMHGWHVEQAITNNRANHCVARDCKNRNWRRILRPSLPVPSVAGALVYNYIYIIERVYVYIYAIVYVYILLRSMCNCYLLIINSYHTLLYILCTMAGTTYSQQQLHR